MNSVSWFLYVAEFFSRVGVLFAVAAGIGAIIVGMALIFHGVEDGELWRPVRWAAPLVFFIALLAAAVPSKNTMYAIAASQVGEKIVESETVQGIATDATKALQQWIKKQIEPEAKK